MAWASTVPAALDALVAMWRAADGLGGVTVLDGPEVGNPSAMEVLSVGWAGGDSETDVDAQVAAEGLAAAPDRERYTITCAAAVLNGSGDVRAARVRAYEIVAAAGAEIARDRTLGNVVMQAAIGTATLTQTQGDRGAQATVVFGVDVDAYTAA